MPFHQGVTLTDQLEPLESTTEAETELAIEELSALVGPVLNQLFRNAATNEDMWLKKKSVKHLAGWIQSTQDIADVMRQTIEQASEVISQQEAELEQLRPEKKVWIPGT